MKWVTLVALSIGPGFSQANECASVEACRKVLQVSPHESMAHYRMGDILFREKNYQKAANEFREALNGNLDPKWIEVWSHVSLGKIFDISNQRERALQQYREAVRITDNTRGALDEARRYIESPYSP